MGRRKKCDNCTWISTDSKRGPTWKCFKCGDVFPCASECGHVDCHLEKARKYAVCGKRVKNTLPGQFFIVDGNRAKSYIVHEHCVDEDAVTLTVKEL